MEVSGQIHTQAVLSPRNNPRLGGTQSRYGPFGEQEIPSRTQNSKPKPSKP
jgi:hypothetical protein